MARQGRHYDRGTLQRGLIGIDFLVSSLFIDHCVKYTRVPRTQTTNGPDESNIESISNGTQRSSDASVSSGTFGTFG